MIPRKNTAKDLWKPKKRIEVMYKRRLKQLANKMKNRLKELTTTAEIINELKKFTNSPEFKRYADREAMKMVTNLFSDAGQTWREAARANSKGKGIYEALKKELNGSIGGAINDQIQRNANLIKSMPLNISKEITEHVAKETFKGRRAEYIAEDLQKKIPYMFESKAKLIARTEVSKTSTALTRARAENIGLNWYRWRTSEDQRVRSSHSHMEGVLINWNNPPSPEKLTGERFVGYYHAGNIYNCRCYPEVVVTLDLIKWPCKVYHNGSIKRMTRGQFEGII
ncbi:phage head morphogenesis protein [Clostridium tetani]|uniref:phage head morphogenesis protein n=1 Tax=Clostridium tetani TaxID=1513 RepID=UPI00100A6986|nr:phage minor head protein [Clostridium tetani]RXI46079.1 phage head morphogenesis protein [Clostridium tetani]RXM61471.1 phage head morphogenesis protein [Clostridium tetani]RXM70296.1 phage head morphogenesis protein [Clostridium tetani]